MSGEKQIRAYHKRAGTIACGALLLAALGGAVPLSGQVTPPSAAVPGDWTWMNGSNSVDGAGQYGMLGVPAGLGNFPGSRWGATGWVDYNGNLWLFGGFGYGDAATFGYLNDLWEFNPSTNSWTWMGGDKTFNANYCGDAPTYGPPGSFGPAYFPGGRQSAASWTDKNGNLWLFGGEGDGAGPPGSGGACGGAYTFGYLNDFWEFNPSIPNSATGSNGEWAWMGGSSAPNVSGTYPAAMYEYSSGVAPGARYEASTWTDSSGDFWLFGGEGYDANGNFGELNDLWQFNPSLNEWAWMGGSNTVPAYSGQPGVYGSMGTPAAGNFPGGRYGASSWADSSGNLWLFGGEGFDGVGNSGNLNDLWEFNRSVGEYGEWVWMGGSSAISGSGWPGVYGTQGTPAAENIPGGRYEAASWTDSSGHFWLFGGEGTGLLYDLWAFDPSTSQWVWMDGSSLANQPGVYAPLYSPASTNIPGGRSEATSWTDKDGNLWLFGGDGRSGGSAVGALSDLWVYPPPSISFGGTAAATPVFSVASGTYSTTQTVSISDATAGAIIYYTTNGSTPTTGSSLYLSSTPITVSSTEALEAIATSAGDSTSAVGTAVYTITPPAATPTFSPVAGTYPSAQTVTISDTTLGATIFYTTNGTTPSFSGSGPSPVPNPGTIRYSGQITVSSTETIEAIATAYGYSPSAVATALYTIGIAPAVVTDNEIITVSDTESFPDVADAEKITVTDTEVVRAYTPIVIAPSSASFNASSGTGYATYAYAPVTFTATGGTGTLTLSESGALPSGVTFSNGVLGGTLSASSAGTYPFSVTAADTYGDSATLQGYTLTIQPASAFPAVVTDDETITVTDTETFPDVADAEKITVTDTVTVTALPLAATPAFSVAAGTYTSAQTVTISDTTPNATIYYAINGTPTTSSSVYNSSSPITVSSTETLEAIATASGYSTSALKTADYTINLPNPAPVVDSISPAFINAGSAAFTLTVNGSGFIASSTVYWGTSALATTYGSATQLTAQVTAADIATAGTTAAITVQTPTPGGGTSNALQFEVDSAPGTTTGPVFTSSTATVAAGSTANYPVTLASGVMSVTVTCLNLPPGATCNYVPGPPGTVTIATSSSTPAGTYQITVVFTLTESGSGTGFILLPILLLPLVFLRRKLAARSVWITACLGLVLLAGVAFVGCGGDATHQATSSGVVTLTVQ